VPPPLRAIVDFFRPAPAAPPIEDAQLVARLYRRWRTSVFLSITIGYAFFYTTRLGLSVAKKPMLDAGVLTVAEMGRVGSALLIGYAIGKSLNGFVTDHVDLRRFFVAGLVLSCLANIVFGSTSLFLVLAVAWFFNGWFQGVGAPSGGVAMASWFSNRERGTRYGIWSTSHAFGELYVFWGVAILVSEVGWRGAFLGPGLLCLAVAFVLWHTHADRPPSLGLPRVADYMNDHDPDHFEDAKVPVRRLQWEVLTNPWVWAVGLSSALMYVPRYGINNWGVLYLQVEHSYSLVDAGSIVGWFPIAAIPGSALSGIVSDRLFAARRGPATFVYGVFFALGLFGFYFAPPGHPWVLGGSMVVAGFAIGGLLVYLGGLTAMDMCSKRASGAALGFIGGFSYLGAACQDWVSGALIEAGRRVTAATTTYDFTAAKYVWVGGGVLSLCAGLSIWIYEARAAARREAAGTTA
jgi:OPA family sugar phosphate sensor protein UhpC-like MFS transporter